MAELGPRYPLVDCKWAVAGSFRSLFSPPQRLMYDSRARAIAHGDMTLPTVRSQSDVQALVDYLDGVFATMTTQHSFLGSPYPAIAWSPNQVIAEQADSDAGRPLPSVRSNFPICGRPRTAGTISSVECKRFSLRSASRPARPERGS